jgi:hypothetical protein
VAPETMSSFESVAVPPIPPDFGLGTTICFVIDSMTIAKQKINMRTNRLTHISWKAALQMRKRWATMNGSTSPCHKSLKNRRILSKEIVARKVRCHNSLTPTPAIAEDR